MTATPTYPAHLYEPLRREIGVHSVQHELRKLLPAIREPAVWQTIDEQIAEWPQKLLMRDFWNGVHGISMGFRLKSLVPWITSLHVRWEERQVSIDELWFGAKLFGPLTRSEIVESGAATRELLFQLKNRELLEKTKIELREKAAESAPRDHFPIFVVRKENQLRVIDGNRRLLQAITDERTVIQAVVGEAISSPIFYEHWVPTSLLIDLVFWHSEQARLGHETTKAAAQEIAELIRDSSIGRSEFTERSVHSDNPTHLRLMRAVAEILSSYGIELKN